MKKDEMGEGGRRKDPPVLLSLPAISFRVQVILSLEYPTSLDTLVSSSCSAYSLFRVS